MLGVAEARKGAVQVERKLFTRQRNGALEELKLKRSEGRGQRAGREWLYQLQKA